MHVRDVIAMVVWLGSVGGWNARLVRVADLYGRNVRQICMADLYAWLDD